LVCTPRDLAQACSGFMRARSSLQHPHTLRNSVLLERMCKFLSIVLGSCAHGSAELRAIVDGLHADHPDIPRHAIDITTQSARTTCLWSREGSRHLVLPPWSIKKQSGRNFPRRWSAALRLRQVGTQNSPLIQGSLTCTVVWRMRCPAKRATVCTMAR
jgi:hypothetical protein